MLVQDLSADGERLAVAGPRRLGVPALGGHVAEPVVHHRDVAVPRAESGDPDAP